MGESRYFWGALLCLMLSACATNHSVFAPRRARSHDASDTAIRRAGEIRAPAARVTDGYGIPSSPAWVCEVEGSEKIFTGIGASQAEAFAAAHSTCESHLSASYCQKTECKENL